jgi:hypothetical protein
MKAKRISMQIRQPSTTLGAPPASHTPLLAAVSEGRLSVWNLTQKILAPTNDDSRNYVAR